MSLRVIFWGNSESVFSGRHFEALLAEECEFAAVVNSPSASAKETKQGSTNPLSSGQRTFVERAQEKGIRIMAPANPNQPDFVGQLQQLSPDLFIAAGYDRILKPQVLTVPKFLSANFHASLLPDYRGKHPIFWTLRGGERWAGLTVHVMDPGIDTGDIIYQLKVRTRRDDTVGKLYQRIIDRSVSLIGRLLKDIEEGSVPRRAQPAGQGSYFSSIKEEDYLIDWSWKSEKIRRHIVMTPGRCFSDIAGHRLYLHQADRTRSLSKQAPGTIVNIGRKRITIASGDGAVWLGLASLEGGSVLSLVSICQELGASIGTMLG